MASFALQKVAELNQATEGRNRFLAPQTKQAAKRGGLPLFRDDIIANVAAENSDCRSTLEGWKVAQMFHLRVASLASAALSILLSGSRRHVRVY